MCFKSIIVFLCVVYFVATCGGITIDSQLVQKKRICYERVALGERLPVADATRRIDTSAFDKCENECTIDEDRCHSFSFGISAKGNGTCELSAREVTNSKDIKILGAIADPDFDIFAKISNCEDSDIRDPLVKPRPDQDPILDSPTDRPHNDNQYGASGRPPAYNEKPNYNRPQHESNSYGSSSSSNNYKRSNNSESYSPSSGSTNKNSHYGSRPSNQDKYYNYENTNRNQEDKLYWRRPGNPYIDNGADIEYPSRFGERHPYYNDRPYRRPSDYDRDYYRPHDRHEMGYGAGYEDYRPYNYYDRPIGPERPLYHDREDYYRPNMNMNQYGSHLNMYSDVAHVYGQEISVSYGGAGYRNQSRPYRPNDGYRGNGYDNLSPEYGSNRPMDRYDRYGTPSSSYDKYPTHKPTNGYGDRPDFPSNKPDYTTRRPAYGTDGYGNRPKPLDRPEYTSGRPSYGTDGYGNRPEYTSGRPSYGSDGYGNRPEYTSGRPSYGTDGYGNRPEYTSGRPSYGTDGYGNRPKPVDRPEYTSGRPAYGTDDRYPISKPDHGYENRPSDRPDYNYGTDDRYMNRPKPVNLPSDYGFGDRYGEMPHYRPRPDYGGESYYSSSGSSSSNSAYHEESYYKYPPRRPYDDRDPPRRPYDDRDPPRRPYDDRDRPDSSYTSNDVNEDKYKPTYGGSTSRPDNDGGYSSTSKRPQGSYGASTKKPGYQSDERPDPAYEDRPDDDDVGGGYGKEKNGGGSNKNKYDGERSRPEGPPKKGYGTLTEIKPDLSGFLKKLLHKPIIGYGDRPNLPSNKPDYTNRRPAYGTNGYGNRPKPLDKPEYTSGRAS